MERSRLLGALVATLSLVPLMAQAQNAPPVADAGPDQYIWVDEFTVLQGSATDANNDIIVDWLWNVDSSPAGSTPRIYEANFPDSGFDGNTAGTYDLSLMAYDGVDWSNPDSMSVFVAELLGPTADATADVTSGVSPLTVQFDASGSLGPMLFDGTSTFSGAGTGWDDGSIDWSTLTYSWGFGDGSDLSFDVAPSHTYTAPGFYTADLVVYDGNGQYDFAAIQINVSAVPVPPAVWLFGSGLLGLVGMARRRGKAA